MSGSSPVCAKSKEDPDARIEVISEVIVYSFLASIKDALQNYSEPVLDF